MKKTILTPLIIASLALILISCENNSQSTNISSEPTSVTVNFDAQNELGISDEELDDYTITSSTSSSPASARELEIETHRQDVISLSNESGQPLLMGRKFSGDQEVEVSIDSSAEMFVLMTPRFNGVQATDPKELSKRIRQHESFSSLTKAIKHAIDSKNPCPLSPGCNYISADIAIELADGLNIDDLYEEVD